MSRLATAAILLASIAFAVSLRAQLKTTTDVELMVLNANASAPRLSVLLCNHGANAVFVRRDLSDVGYDPQNPLQAHIFDIHTGKRVSNRYEYKRASRSVSEVDFIELKPAYCYGLTIDVRDHFLVKAGGRYRIHFTYTSASPSKVGRITPWKGPATSKKITITMAKHSAR